MNEDNSDIQCECMHKKQDYSSELTISLESAACCSSKTIELTNNNHLQKTGSELPKDISSFTPLYINTDTEISNNFKSVANHAGLKDHVPRTEIPILISSLLL